MIQKVMGRCRTFRILLPLAAVVLLAVAPAVAQTSTTAGARVYQEQLRVDFDQQSPSAREMGVDAGGWFNFSFVHFHDDGGRRQRSVRQYELRGWATMNLKGVHQAYVRGLLGWTCWSNDDHPSAGRENDFDDKLERAWYQFDLGRLLSLENNAPSPVDFKVKIGRAYTSIGTALTLSMPLDLVRFDVAVQNWEFMAFLGKTVRHTRNIDDSPAVANQERCLYGFQLRYRGLNYHRPFVYYFANSDHTSARNTTPVNQRYDYSTRYIGIGSEGSLLLRDLSYRAEIVGEWGRTFSNAPAPIINVEEDTVYPPAARDEVCAWAADIWLEYLFRVKTHPRVSFEYLFGSGDSDRGTSATATLGGNTGGTKDNAFNAFGFRDTGVAMAPKVSNLHMISLGGRCNPFEDVRLLEKMELGTSVFFYMKDKNAGPISDSTANVDAQWIGWEWDVYCNWRITSDLVWTTRYGVFMPGAAYGAGNDSPRHFIYGGITLSF